MRLSRGAVNQSAPPERPAPNIAFNLASASKPMTVPFKDDSYWLPNFGIDGAIPKKLEPWKEWTPPPIPKLPGLDPAPKPIIDGYPPPGGCDPSISRAANRSRGVPLVGRPPDFPDASKPSSRAMEAAIAVASTTPEFLYRSCNRCSTGRERWWFTRHAL